MDGLNLPPESDMTSCSVRCRESRARRGTSPATFENSPNPPPHDNGAPGEGASIRCKPTPSKHRTANGRDARTRSDLFDVNGVAVVGLAGDGALVAVAAPLDLVDVRV